MIKKLKVILKISVLSFLFVGLIGTNALALQKPAENNERVDVLIGFYQAPGNSERNMVRGYGGEIYREFTIVNVIAAQMTPQAADALAQNPGVRYVEPDALVDALGQAVPWGIDRIFGDESYSFDTWGATRGEGIAVAILDTGIQLDHPDLNVVHGVDCTKGPDCDRGGDGDDDRGHGTHVAGTVAALDNNIGVVGVAPKADLYSVKVLTKVGGRYSDVIKGIEWSVGNNMNVVNMSLGATTYSQSLETAVDVAYENGLLLVAAAGNNGNWDTVDPVYPAAYESVMAIGAIEEGDEIAEFSNWTSGVELVAPGVEVLSTYIGSTYYKGSGTSMAAPHVAGVAALVWAANSILTNVELRNILWETAEDLHTTTSHQGRGLVRADLAVRAVAEIVPPATGNIEGTVKDEAEAAIEGATVVVEGANLSATTDTSGYYLLENVPVGDQSITASAEGYYFQTITVTVEEDVIVEQNFTLEAISPVAQKMHVNSIEMWDKAAGINRFVYTKVEIASFDSTPVSGATVYLKMTLPDGSTASGSGNTANDGTITFELKSRQTGTYTSTVTDVVKDGWEYDSSENVETSKTIVVN